MNTYYVAGVPYSDELFHFGIKGQRWGIRRYQNPDGTLTAAGKARYGDSLGDYAREKPGVIRKLATGDWILGKKRSGERRENRLANKIVEMENKGKNADRLRLKYEVQKRMNVSRDVYNSSRSTGLLFAQKLVLGRTGADTYRIAVERGVDPSGAAFASFILSINGMVPVMSATSAYATKQDIIKERKRD